MFQHRRLAQRVPMHVLAILATALVACGTVTGAGSAGRSATAGSDAPSDVRLTEFEYEGQATAPRTIAPVEVRVEGTSDAAGADTYLVP
jgi:hypothetical protein